MKEEKTVQKWIEQQETFVEIHTTEVEGYYRLVGDHIANDKYKEIYVTIKGNVFSILIDSLEDGEKAYETFRAMFPEKNLPKWDKCDKDEKEKWKKIEARLINR